MPTDELAGSPVERRLFDSLAGEWSLSRTIPGQGSVTGTARFEPRGPALLHYREEGRLVLTAGPALDVSREYFYVLEPGAIRVAFAEAGRPGGTLHRLRPAAPDGVLEAGDVHHCGADTYDGRYRFERDHRVGITVVVRGPAKDYAIHTTLERRSSTRHMSSGG